MNISLWLAFSIRSTETDNTKIGLCHSLEADNSSAQISQLKQKLADCETKIQRLTQLVGNMAEQQLKVVYEVVKMKIKKCRTLSIPPPEMETLDSPTSSASSTSLSVLERCLRDGTQELDDSSSDSDSNDGDSLVPSLTSWVPTPFTAPVSTSRRPNISLERIEEEDEEDSPPLSPVAQIGDESDN